MKSLSRYRGTHKGSSKAVPGLHTSLSIFTLSSGWWFLDRYFKLLWERVKQNFLIYFIIGASETTRFARLRIFRYGCLMIILSNRQKEREGPCFMGLKAEVNKCFILYVYGKDLKQLLIWSPKSRVIAICMCTKCILNAVLHFVHMKVQWSLTLNLEHQIKKSPQFPTMDVGGNQI